MSSVSCAGMRVVGERRNGRVLPAVRVCEGCVSWDECAQYVFRPVAAERAERAAEREQAAAQRAERAAVQRERAQQAAAERGVTLNWRANLTMEQAAWVRVQALAGATTDDLAAKFGVSATAMRQVLRGSTYRVAGGPCLEWSKPHGGRGRWVERAVG